MNDLTAYAIRRIFQSVFIVLAVTILLFAIMHMMPGDPIQLIDSPRLDEATTAKLRARWGLDKPPVVQYLYWLLNVLKGDLGRSITNGQSVSVLLAARLPATLHITLTALLLQYLVAVPLGLMAGYHQGSVFDRLAVSVTSVLRAIPYFWLGILLIIVFAVSFRLLPVSGYRGFQSLILPVLTLTLPALADTLRLTRSEVLEVLREKHVTTAVAKGLRPQMVLLRHVLRNALVPVTVMFFLSVPWLIGGSVIVETIFAWPGTGRLLWKAISAQDYPVVQGIILLITLLTVISTTIGDILTGLLDPRIRAELGGRVA
ncbi:MAG: ABC transporter permease [Desulfobacterales bacterium]|nr:ABC transporter permease [Desulfobacterales bacterium]